MTRPDDSHDAGRDRQEFFAARIGSKPGEEAQPEGSPEPGEEVHPESLGGGTSQLLKRLAAHGGPSSRYKLEGEIARGGMGAILRVWDEGLRRHLAMKVVLGKGDAPGEGGTPAIDPRVLARFLEEAQVTGQLDHPGIVPVHELGLDADGRVYFTMKLVKGRDLKAIFDLVFQGKEGWNQTRALGAILRACEAMAYAHKKGVIHRDLKPANVMVGSFGEVFVMDWGLARVLGRKDSHDIRLAPEFTAALSSLRTERREEREDAPDSPIVTMDGDVMGTPAYMPPEQARGEIEKLTPRSDVYSIGAMLYHLLAKQMPYVPPGARVSNRTVLGMVLQGPPTSIGTIDRQVPAELAAICEKAMAREAERRYPDTLALAEDLRAYLEHRVVSAYETGALAELKKWVARNQGLAAASAAAVAILIGGLVLSSSLYVKAEDKATEAERERKIAQQRADDVFSLSAIQDLKDLVQRADTLWPVQPENITAFEGWVRDAHGLLDGQPADEEKGIKGRPSLADHRRKLTELEARALPHSSEERAAERASHPRHAELEHKKAELEWVSRMLGISPWPSEADVGRELAKSALPSDAKGFNDLAWPLVDPDQPVYGHEVKALVLARSAVEGASAAERPLHLDTLAWALCRNGRFDEARAVEGTAVAEVPEGRRNEFEGYLARIDAVAERWTSEEGRRQQRADRERLSAEVAELERDVSRPRAWRFAGGEERWWHAQLSNLVADLEAFSAPKTGLCSAGIAPDSGWGVERRLEYARTIEERSVTGSGARKRWEEAIASIRDRARSPKYDGVVIGPQLGLLPIGRDADSGLWEFADLATGERAERDEPGKLVVTQATGLVFVLIPGGTFRMGAQNTDPTADQYDPRSAANESPVHEVTLSYFFLSKYEMTQGQWQRLTGSNPSLYGPHNYNETWNAGGTPADLLHPVEQVSWEECLEVLPRVGLTLPTEAQWEHACRAGTATVYWSGDEAESLQGVANTSDAYGKFHGNEGWSAWEESLDDGQTVHAPIGGYRANPFGLLDVHGNVWEWCLDFYGRYDVPVREGDGKREVHGPATCVFRGGSFAGTSGFARSAVRRVDAPARRGSGVGLRPARSVTPR